MSARVMMVDDSDSDLLFTRLALERCGVPCEVLAFDRAEQALAHLAGTPSHGIGLILLDINMPVMDGFAFLEAFEALAPEQRGTATVAMLSSSTSPADRARAQDFSSVRSYLTKPLGRREAAAVVQSVAL